jgi:hypothetical protein
LNLFRDFADLIQIGQSNEDPFPDNRFISAHLISKLWTIQWRIDGVKYAMSTQPKYAHRFVQAASSAVYRMFLHMPIFAKALSG